VLELSADAPAPRAGASLFSYGPSQLLLYGGLDAEGAIATRNLCCT
jgi:hypothetical protein